MVNVVKAGAAVPAEFRLGGDQDLDVVASVRVVPAAGECGAVEHQLVETLPASSQGGLHYDAASDTYTYVWKTPKHAFPTRQSAGAGFSRACDGASAAGERSVRAEGTRRPSTMAIGQLIEAGGGRA